jgi:hypothetical protein
MAVLVTADVAGVTKAMYDRLDQRIMAEMTPEAMQSCHSHAVVIDGSGMHIVDIWESERDFDAFFDQLSIHAKEVGMPAITPHVRQIHQYMTTASGR